MNKLIEKAEVLLEKCDVCSVASITENDFPRICILRQLKTKGIETLWFSTGTSSHKVAHYSNNNRAGVTFYDGGDSVTLIGYMQIVSDKAEKDSLWMDWLGKHFANGGKEDPEYCVIKFVSTEATIYIDGEFETIEIS